MTSEITTLYSSRDNRVIITIKPGVEQVKYSDHDLIRVRAICMLVVNLVVVLTIHKLHASRWRGVLQAQEQAVEEHLRQRDPRLPSLTVLNKF